MTHTWSLAVEEYFLLVWPVLIVITVAWFGRSRLLPAMLAVTTAAIALVAFIVAPTAISGPAYRMAEPP